MSAREWACQVLDTDTYMWRIVGVGVTENRESAEEDVRAWDGDGYRARLVCRAVGPWEPSSPTSRSGGSEATS